MRPNIVFFCLIFVFGGCTPIFPPPGLVVIPPPANYENPDKYQVNPENYPLFRVKHDLKPPTWILNGVAGPPMVPIESSDIWRVTHRVGDVLLIYSESYNARQCRFLAQLAPHGIEGGFIRPWGSKCYADYLYHIPISAGGTVQGGWKLLKNPEVTVSARDRYIDMQVDPATPVGWGPQPLFVPVR